MFSDRLSTDIRILDKVNGYLSERTGKQLRPIFTLLTARALRGFCNENVIRCAAAVEMLHTATLLHDDVADDSSIRRGSPTIRALYSPTTSVLVGDFWLSRAIETIVGYCDQRVILSFSSSLEMLAEGEMIQLEKAEKLDTTEEDYFKIIYCKTASLFETAILSPAYCVNANDGEIEAMREYARHIGTAFQIMDDIMDYSPQLNIGKPSGQDILEKKVTLPLFGYLRNTSQKEAGKLLARIRRIGENPDDDKGFCREAVDLVNRYGGVEYARKRLETEISAGIESIDILSESKAKSYLVELAGHMAVRTR
ncbi:MAG: polyprenyl synthetase family protein [Bacteroidales bacterium]|nr:polyprenyl synthetase family protein [Candidatus Cacconaster merdequi]